MVTTELRGLRGCVESSRCRGTKPLKHVVRLPLVHLPCFQLPTVQISLVSGVADKLRDVRDASEFLVKGTPAHRGAELARAGVAGIASALRGPDIDPQVSDLESLTENTIVDHEGSGVIQIRTIDGGQKDTVLRDDTVEDKTPITYQSFNEAMQMVENDYPNASPENQELMMDNLQRNFSEIQRQGPSRGLSEQTMMHLTKGAMRVTSNALGNKFGLNIGRTFRGDELGEELDRFDSMLRKDRVLEVDNEDLAITFTDASGWTRPEKPEDEAKVLGTVRFDTRSMEKVFEQVPGWAAEHGGRGEDVLAEAIDSGLMNGLDKSNPKDYWTAAVRAKAVLEAVDASNAEVAGAELAESQVIAEQNHEEINQLVKENMGSKGAVGAAEEEIKGGANPGEAKAKAAQEISNTPTYSLPSVDSKVIDPNRLSNLQARVADLDSDQRAEYIELAAEHSLNDVRFANALQQQANALRRKGDPRAAKTIEAALDRADELFNDPNRDQILQQRHYQRLAVQANARINNQEFLRSDRNQGYLMRLERSDEEAHAYFNQFIAPDLIMHAAHQSNMGTGKQDMADWIATNLDSLKRGTLQQTNPSLAGILNLNEQTLKQGTLYQHSQHALRMQKQYQDLSDRDDKVMADAFSNFSSGGADFGEAVVAEGGKARSPKLGKAPGGYTHFNTEGEWDAFTSRLLGSLRLPEKKREAVAQIELMKHNWYGNQFAYLSASQIGLLTSQIEQYSGETSPKKFSKALANMVNAMSQGNDDTVSRSIIKQLITPKEIETKKGRPVAGKESGRTTQGVPFLPKGSVLSKEQSKEIQEFLAGSDDMSDLERLEKLQEILSGVEQTATEE